MSFQECGITQEALRYLLNPSQAKLFSSPRHFVGNREKSLLRFLGQLYGSLEMAQQLAKQLPIKPSRARANVTASCLVFKPLSTCQLFPRRHGDKICSPRRRCRTRGQATVDGQQSSSSTYAQRAARLDDLTKLLDKVMRLHW